ncbi:hypothetical protein ASF38_15730 [Aeromicrobium sp. Leaf272]|nr:hypothetical protein ASF38_15730 [Aeromicrobium sp. Leaf272]
MTRRRGSRQGRQSKRAKVRAEELGGLRPVKVQRRHPVDGAPLLKAGQVYAFAGGEVFHPAWCGTVGVYWDQHPTSLLVVLRAEVGRRRGCQNCLTHPLAAYA